MVHRATDPAKAQHRLHNAMESLQRLTPPLLLNPGHAEDEEASPWAEDRAGAVDAQALPSALRPAGEVTASVVVQGSVKSERAPRKTVTAQTLLLTLATAAMLVAVALGLPWWLGWRKPPSVEATHAATVTVAAPSASATAAPSATATASPGPTGVMTETTTRTAPMPAPAPVKAHGVGRDPYDDVAVEPAARATADAGVTPAPQAPSATPDAASPFRPEVF